MAPSTLTKAWVAAHRFGLGEPDLAVTGADPAQWLMQQIGPAEMPPGQGLATLVDGVRAQARFQAAQQAASSAAATEAAYGENLRQIVQGDVRAVMASGITTRQPLAERLVAFWSNHFTVATTKGTMRGLCGAFEREAIRPHIAGRFLDMLRAAATHGAMLRYLDNERSMGPRSRAAMARQARLARQERMASMPGDMRPAPSGLNENLAREVLELHTLGAASKAYTQADVTAFAAVLTGWRLVYRPADAANLAPGAAIAGFDAAWHEPGSKALLGLQVPEGPSGLERVLEHLAQHPATAHWLATKLARHFVADDPPASLVRRLAERYSASQGQLSAVYQALIESPEAWDPTPTKLKTPQEFVVSAYRLVGAGTEVLARQPDGGVSSLGQRLHAAPSPAGWPDRQEDGLGPEAVWRRVEWATRLADRAGQRLDARALARRALGPALSEATARQIDRAADGPQALALLLLAPEFQRR
ncbi:MAG: DUF1800 family protein [Rubrivivax sp.]